jgi:hypothetical protein
MQIVLSLGTGNTVCRGGWTKPAAGVHKLNIDAAYDPETGKEQPVKL